MKLACSYVTMAMVSISLVLLMACSDDPGEDIDGEGIIDRKRVRSGKCPPYSTTIYPRDGYCYPD